MLWWGPTYEIFPLIDWLSHMIDLLHYVTCMWLFFICILTLSLMITFNLWLRYTSYPIMFIYLLVIMYVMLSHLWLLFDIHDYSINYHHCFTLLVETRFRGLEGCYGFYCTFPIGNPTLGPRLNFLRTRFSK